MRFKRQFRPDDFAPYFLKRERAMRNKVFRIHHMFFMSEGTVSEYVF